MYDDKFNNFLDRTLVRPSKSRTFADGFGLKALIAKCAVDPLFRRPETSVNRGDSILRASCLEETRKFASRRIPSGVSEPVFDLQATIRDLCIKTRKIDSTLIPSRDRVVDLQATIRDLCIKTRKIDSLRIPSGVRVFDLQATIRDLWISVRDQSKNRLEASLHFLKKVSDERFLKASLIRARLNAIFPAAIDYIRLIGRSSAFRSRTGRAGWDRSASGIDPRSTHMPEFP